MKNIPFDIAFELDDITRTGWCIHFSEMDGSKFNFNTMSYDEQK